MRRVSGRTKKRGLKKSPEYSEIEWRKELVNINPTYVASGEIHIYISKKCLVINGASGIQVTSNFPLNKNIAIGSIQNNIPEGYMPIRNRWYSFAMHTTNTANNDSTRYVGYVRMENNNIEAELNTERVAFVFGSIIIPVVPITNI